MYRYRGSRLARKEEARSLRQAVIFGLLTVAIIIVLFFLGLPALIRLAVFLGNLKSSGSSIDNSSTIAPSTPKLRPLLEATNSAQINIEGFADPGSEVEIFLNGSSQKKIASESDGTFSASDITLSGGNNDIYAIASNGSASSSHSESVQIDYDNTAPKLTISDPQDKSVYYSPNNKVTIKGETEDGASVTVNDHLAVVDSTNKFNYYFPLASGENIIKIVAIDQAGNKTEQDLTLTLD